MDTDSFSVPVSLLRQYAFCPRIPFFYLIRNLHPPFRPWVKQGLGFHEKTQMLAKRRKGKTLRIEFSEEIREKVRVITQKILTDCEEALMPSTAASDKQCSQCEYLNFCNDRL